MMLMKKVKKYFWAIMLLTTATLLCIYGVTFAKYVSNFVWDYYLKAKGFYLYSDYLDTSTVKNVNTLWQGESVYFNVKNHLNQEVITNYDITYTILCTINGDASNHTECHLNSKESNTEEITLASYEICINNTEDGVDVSTYNQIDCEAGEYDWVNQPVIKDHHFDVVVTDEEYELTDVTVNITITSTAPYKKILSGDFILHQGEIKEEDITLKYDNYDNYDRLIITNSYPVNKCVKVTWDSSKLIINALPNDFSNYGVDANDYINEIIFNIGAKDSISYIFYPKNFDIIYDVTEFLIEETSGC